MRELGIEVFKQVSRIVKEVIKQVLLIMHRNKLK